MNKNISFIIKFNNLSEQTINGITKIVGLVPANSFLHVIDNLDLEANPRSSKTGAVTEAIQETISKTPELFPFMSKGILLASSNYQKLERNRFKINIENTEIEGILDGGHNTLAIGLYILKEALDFFGEEMPSGSKTWLEFKDIWIEKRDYLTKYLQEMKKTESVTFNFLIPVELLIPENLTDDECVSAFKNNLFEICEARNNNAELQLSAKANQKGYFDKLKDIMEKQDQKLFHEIEWKTNEGGSIKVQDIIALSWIPLNKIVSDEQFGIKKISPVSPVKIYSGKGSCMKQFEKLMASSEVTSESDDNYKRHLTNDAISSALKITADIPKLYDYIFENLPALYNKNGGHFAAINAVDKLNKKKKIKKTPFTGKKMDNTSLTPDGFITPLIYGLQALLEIREVDGKKLVVWSQDPMTFLQNNLEKIVKEYSGMFSICNNDPQKVGKAPQSYTQATNAFKMAVAGIL